MRLAVGILAVACGLAGQTGVPLTQAIEDLRAGRLDRAEQAITRIVQQDPESADAHYYLGVVYFQSDRLPLAAQTLTRAVQLAPSRARFWKALGAAYASMGDFPMAEEPFRKACELDPREEAVCYYLGRNLYARNQFEPALAAFDTALRHEAPKRRWLVHRGIGLALEAVGRDREAEEHFRRAIRLGAGKWRDVDDPRLDYGVFLFRQGRTEEALAPLQQAVKGFPSSARAQFELGRALAQLNRLDAALPHLERAIAADPKYWAAHLLLGKTYVRLGRLEEGERHLELGGQGVAEEESRIDPMRP